MATVVKICDKNDNKYSGFELCQNVNINKLFPHGAYEGCEFEIGKYLYKVTKVYVDNFVDDTPTQQFRLGRDTLDGGTYNMGSHIWVCCETEDPRIQEANATEENLQKIASDLGIV